MDNPNPSQHNPARRGSLSLSQTFSLDWTASPPPADLEQIHASSSQTPGLTSFSLGSPPATQHEPLILNRIFSRVKGFADAVRDAVGGPNTASSSPPTRSLFSGPFGGDRYNKQSASRDSFQSLGNGSDDAASQTSIKSPLSSKSHLRQQSVTSMQSGVSRVSGPGSIAGPEYAQPSALRKVNQMATTPRPTTNASVDQVTVYRGRIGEASSHNMASMDISRTQSLTSIREGTSNVPIEGKSNSAVGAFIGAVGNVVGPTTGFGSAVSGNSHMIARPFIEADDDFDDSASDGTLSDSSDDDLVMLHSRLPVGPGGRPRQEMPKNLINGPPERKVRTRSSASAAAAKDKSDFKERVLLPPPATSDSFAAPDSNMLTPSEMTPAVHIISPQTSGQSGQNPGISASSLPSLSGVDSRSSSGSPDLRKDIARKNKPFNDKALLLPGYKISGDRSSETDSTTPGPSQTANEHKGEATSSIYKQDGFGEGKMVNGTHSGGITGSTEAVSQALRQLRMGNLTRDFWMKDEVCKDCFLCGTTFTAWRRKHHCRLCGQIFCAKCTTLISGDKFGHQGSMRVCSPCLNIVNDYQDYSDSDDTSPDIIHRRPSMTGSKSMQNTTGESSLTGFKMPNNLRPGQTPLMAIPATRTTPNNNPNRRSQILEINADIPSPPRPTSSRSIKAGPRPATSNSSTKAPFHRSNADERRKKMLPAFHADNILDPDLAPYMSDEEMTDGEQMSVFATIAPKATDISTIPNNPDDFEVGTPVVPKSERTPVNNGSMRRRNRSKSRGSISGLGALLGDGGVAAAGSDKGPKRTSKRRGSSFIGPLQRPATRAGKSRGLMKSLAESVGGQANLPVTGNSSTASPRASRSASMRGPFAPNIELNTASLEHVKKLLRQLLTDADIPNVKQWEDALIPILLKSTDDLNPDLRNGDSIDIRHYVKVKRIPGAKPGDTSYVSGVVFTKNLALKSMPRNISQPRIVVVTFPIEYSRHQQQLMSLEPVIAQEKEFLTNMVNRIVALRPTLLLVQKNVSGLALSMLAKANVATAYLVKPSVIEAVSRCAEADIFSSVDKLALSTFKLGRSASFDVKTFVHPDIPGTKKTFMFLSGCQKELGCTIVLRGASMELLARIKQITELMVYVVYNLKLETCLMRDEFVTPTAPTAPIGPSATQIVPLSDDALPDDLPNPTYYEDMVRKHETKLLSASPFVSYMQPYLLTRARELERKLAYLRRLRDELSSDPEKKMLTVKPKPRENFVLVDPLAVHGGSNLNMTRKASEVLRAIYDAEYDKALHVYETQKRQWENYLSQYDDLFDPFAHQSIAVLYSMVCTITTIPCEGPEIRRLEFYGQDNDWTIGKSDCTLGQYIEYLCDTANHNCDSTSCDRPMLNHHRSYVHGQARVSVLVSNEISCPIQGMQNTILMWSYCKVKECGTNTPAIPMSESSWKYSFGKYLELAFWSSEMKMRTGNCPHDINRDHVRCFGYHGLTVMFQFDTIELLEIVVPRTRITYKPEIDLRVKNEQYTQNEGRIKAFFYSVKARLKGINMESVSPGKIESCHMEIEALMNRAQEDEDWLIAKLQEKYNKSKYYEIIPLNRALRALQEKVIEWDSKFSAFDANYFPSEKDIRRLAALQLKKIFLDNTPSPSLPSEENLTPMNEKGEGSKPISIDGTSTPGTSALNSPVAFSADQAHDVLASVVEEEKERDKGKSSTILDNSRRRPPPGLSRTVSVPTVPTRRDMSGPLSAGLSLRSPTMPGKKLTQGPPPVGKATEKLRPDKKDKFRLNSLAQKPTDKTPKTQIPRSVPVMQLGPKRPIRESPKVSSLAKHFEQLSKEFERERAKERKELAAKRVRALPVATSRPIVEIYRNAREAVEEGSDEEEDIDSHMTGKTTTGDQINQNSDADADASDDAMSSPSDHETLDTMTLGGVLPPVSEADPDSSQLDTKLNLPQHRTAWMKMLTNFWAERSASGWTSLEYPLHPTDHVFNDSDIIVREDEPSSLIAFTLNCEDYIEKLDDIRNSDYSHLGGHGRPQSSEEHLHRHSFNLQEHPELERSLLKTTGTHLKYQFQEGTAKMFCKVFYAEQFDALRRNCGIADRYVESLSRCIKWDSRGGKTRSVFLKTQDERIVLKSLSPVETSAFIKFAPAYFQFMAEAFFHELPTVIAKMLGFYQIMIKNPSTGTEIKWDILVMENLFYDRKTSRIFDLKGSMRNRYMQSTGEQNEVLLDENMVEFIYESPLFVREHSKKLLRASLWNDTLFLSRQNVMDYSLMIGIDEDRKELCVGIIDCIRTFTWDKMLESWVKEKGLAGGGRKQPTVTSPREYKHRFREAMERYVLEAPRYVPKLDTTIK
ncbi:hypothetical protein BZA77DRAFT_238883 [Pyronema omphalodes]|nr:hypothetical protein BZA77DRAFT_238883 [Pyronema omphalodes]